MLSLPDTGLLARDSMSEWLERFGATPMSRRLLMSSALILFGEITPQRVVAARRWLRRQSACSTAEVLSKLVARARPKVLVDTATTESYRLERLEHIRSAFPDARFMHLTRHPVGYGNSLLGLWKARRGGRAASQVARLVDDPESMFYRLFDPTDPQPVCDPQESWYVRQATVAAFTATLEPARFLIIRTEDVLRDTLRTLRWICQWLEVEADEDALDVMLGPPEPRHAGLGFGSVEAMTAGDAQGLDDDPNASLDGEVPWLPDGRGLAAKVRNLAGNLGYQ